MNGGGKIGNQKKIHKSNEVNFLILIKILFLLSIIVVSWTYLGYPLSLWTFCKITSKKKHLDLEYAPKVSIIIPTYNEEKTIKEKLENCLDLEYDIHNIEILVVDSASTDNTRTIVKEFIEKQKNSKIRLITEKTRKGKAAAVNKALQISEGEIVLITDANAFMESNTLKELMKHFADPKVGGVEGKYILKIQSNHNVSHGESFFRKLENWIREKETRIDSVFSMVGEISSFRKEIIDKLDENIIAEDYEMSIRIRKNGYKLVHEPNAVVWEYAPGNLKDEIIQKKRRVIGTIQVLLKHYNVVFNPKYGIYGMYIIPSHSLIRVVSPFFLLLAFFSSFGYYHMTGSTLMLYFIILEIVMLLIEFLNIVFKIFNFQIKNTIFISINYFLISQIIVLWGWYDFIRGNYKVTWEKIASSRGE